MKEDFTLFWLVFIVWMLVILSSCATRPDPMPKWKGYQLEFTQ